MASAIGDTRASSRAAGCASLFFCAVGPASPPPRTRPDARFVHAAAGSLGRGAQGGAAALACARAKPPRSPTHPSKAQGGGVTHGHRDRRVFAAAVRTAPSFFSCNGVNCDRPQTVSSPFFSWLRPSFPFLPPSFRPRHGECVTPLFTRSTTWCEAVPRVWGRRERLHASRRPQAERMGTAPRALPPSLLPAACS